MIASEPGTHPEPVAEAGVDVYAYTHNETSTGVAAPVKRVAGADAGSLVLVDATSGAAWSAGGHHRDGRVLLRPAEVLRLGRRPVAGRVLPGRPGARRARARRAGDIPEFFSPPTAIDNSLKNQTYNTPALATLFLLDQQLEWMNSQGGLEFTTGRTAASARNLYGWAEASKYATPFVVDADKRSSVIGTIDFSDDIDAAAVAKVLRANGIVDTEPYRKLGRNQLRIAMFPAVDPADVQALTACVDYVIEKL